MAALRYWVWATRPKTLPAAAVPVVLAAALAQHVAALQWTPFALCLFFAVLIQIGTNFANDYFDFVKGADTDERIGPQRAVASGWIAPGAMRLAAGLVFTAAFVCGLFLLPYGGWWLIAVGLLSVACGYAYTGGPYPLGYNGLGDVFVLIFFGGVAVLVSFYLQLGADASQWWPHAAWLAWSSGALATAILAVNNRRDWLTDAKAGKRTLAVRFGPRFVEWEYAVLLCGAQFTPLALWWLGLGNAVLLPLMLLPLSIRLSLRLPRCRSAIDYNRQLAMTAVVLIAFGALQSLGLLFHHGF